MAKGAEAIIRVVIVPISGHVYRAAPKNGIDDDRRGVRGATSARVGTCNWLGTCGRPQDDHITVPDYRARRGGPP